MNIYQDMQNNTQNTWGLLPNFGSKYYANLSVLIIFWYPRNQQKTIGFLISEGIEGT